SVSDDAPRRTQIVDSSTDRTPAKTAFPKYPTIARRDRIEGDATVCFKIDQRGRIRSARVVDVTHPIFKRSAIVAIRQSSFAPLAPNEVLATSRTCRTYRFRLEPILAAEK
ncbi:MAG: TonB family protein, partial [Woeseia sp.]